VTRYTPIIGWSMKESNEMSALRIAIRETRKLQNDEVKRGQLCFTPPADEIDMLNFWLDRLMNRRYFPCGISQRELRVEGLIYAAFASGELIAREAQG
jgi:hypothetical protein